MFNCPDCGTAFPEPHHTDCSLHRHLDKPGNALLGAKFEAADAVIGRRTHLQRAVVALRMVGQEDDAAELEVIDSFLEKCAEVVKKFSRFTMDQVDTTL